MDKNIIIVVDPCGRVVHVPTSLRLAGEPAGAIACLDGLQLAIEAPAGVIEMSGQELFYFRSIACNITILIRVVLQEGVWKAVGCLENPAPEFIQAKLQEGSFTAGSAMG